jgi:CRISPR-associated exonuclease Cas4
MRRNSSLDLRGDRIDIIFLSIVLIIGAILLIACSVWSRWSVHKGKKQYGIPEGSILYSDLNVPAEPLFSRRVRLTGKPDYIIRKENQYVPIEVKTGNGPHPHQSQVLQLAAYCQILEDTTGVFVPEGILVYNNVPYTIRFDPKLRFELETVMKTMRASLRKGVVQRNHHEPGRCRNCSMRQYCTNTLSDDS